MERYVVVVGGTRGRQGRRRARRRRMRRARRASVACRLRCRLAE
jgi:hypothetical protein